MTDPSNEARRSFDPNVVSQQADVLNSVLDHLTQGMAVVGPDYRILAFNRYFEELFQLPSGTVDVGADFRDILRTWAKVTGQDPQVLDRAILQLDQPTPFEWELLQQIKGEPRWCLLTHNPVPGKGCVRTLTDITARKQAETRARDEQERLRVIVESLGDPIFVKDNEHRIVLANRAFYAMLGMDESSVIGKTLAEQLPEEEMRHFLEVDRRVLDTGLPDRCEETLTVNGFSRIIVTTKTRFIEHSGDRFLVGNIHDITERKHAEATTRKLSSVVDQAPISILITDSSGAIEYVNPKFTEMTGYSAAEMAGQNPRLLRAGELSLAAGKELWDTVRAGRIWRGEFHNRKKNGEPFWEEATIAPIRDAQGAVAHLVALKVDITERKRLGEERDHLLAELDRANAELNATVQALPYLVSLHGKDGRYRKVNATVITTFGFDPTGCNREEVAQRLQARFPDGRPLTPANMPSSRALTGEAVQAIEYLITDTRGAQHTLLINAIPLWIQGELQGSVFAQTDITELKRLGAELEYSRGQLRSIVNGTTDAIYVKDVQGRYLLFNSSAEKVVGMPVDEVLGQDDTALFPPQEAAVVMAGDRRVMAGGQVDTYEERVTDAAGRPITLLSTKGPLYDRTGALTGLFGIARDITERKQAEVTLQETRDLLAQFIARSPIHAFIKEVTPTQSRMLYLSENFESFFGRASSEVLGQTMADLFPAQLAEQITGEDWAVVSSGKNLEVEEEIHGRIYSTLKFPIYMGETTLLAGFRIDLTEREHAKRLLATSREQLRLLLARLQRAQEEERLRVSRLVHDELGQLLTELKLDLAWLERRLSAPAMPPEFVPLLDKVMGTSELADATLQTVQRIAAELRPNTLETLGLVPSLRQEARRFQEHSGIPCTVAVEAAWPELETGTALELFYICREALTNVARHAGARQVALSLRREAGVVVFEVGDDGVGLTEAQGSGPHSLGLLGMRERAGQLGGTITFAANQPHGTRVIVHLPLAPSTASERADP